MKKIPKPKFEKVDSNTIRIIVEQAQDVPLDKIIENRNTLLEQKEQIELTLKNINEIIENAKRLGIIPKPKDNKPEKE